MISISAIICTYNREDLILNTLTGLKNQSIDPGLFEIIIVNNNSTDQTETICKQFIEDHPQLNCHYVEEKKQGLSYSRNMGINSSSGIFVTFLDDDSVPDPDFLKVVLDYMESHPECMAAGGKIHLQFVEDKPDWINKYLAPLLGYYDLGNTIKPFSRRDYPRGSNMSFRKEVFTVIGDFNPNLGRKGTSLAGGEEKDLFGRMYHKNLPVVYLPEAKVNHLVPSERTTINYVKLQAKGIGESEKIRTKSNGFPSYMGRILTEFSKWIVSVGLFLFYLVTFQIQKAKTIIWFRFFVTVGLFKKAL